MLAILVRDRFAQILGITIALDQMSKAIALRAFAPESFLPSVGVGSYVSGVGLLLHAPSEDGNTVVGQLLLSGITLGVLVGLEMLVLPRAKRFNGWTAVAFGGVVGNGLDLVLRPGGVVDWIGYGLASDPEVFVLFNAADVATYASLGMIGIWVHHCVHYARANWGKRSHLEANPTNLRRLRAHSSP